MSKAVLDSSPAFRIGDVIFEGPKVRIIEGQEQHGASLWTIKCIQLDEDDLKKEGVEVMCNTIVEYIKNELFPLSHPNLVRYVHASFDRNTRSMLNMTDRTRDRN